MPKLNFRTQKEIRTLLVNAISRPDTIERIVRDSGLDHRKLFWGKDCTTLWQDVLDLAAGQTAETLSALISNILLEAPGLETALRELLGREGIPLALPLHNASGIHTSTRTEDTTPRKRGPDWSTESTSPLPSPIRARRALLIGINAYAPPISSLRYCRRDAEALEAELRSRGYEQVVRLPQAPGSDVVSKNDMRGGLERVLAGASGDDLVWIHFSGHGLRKANTPYLLSSQAAVQYAKDELSVDALVSQANEAGIKRLVLTLDACQTGVDLGRDTPDPEFERALNTLEQISEGVVILSGTTSMHAAVEDATLAHGRFTGWILEWIRNSAISGQTLPTVSSLAEFLGKKALEHYQQQGGFYQKPTLNFQGTGNLLLLR